MDIPLELVNAHFLYPGLAGGLVHAFRDEKFRPWQIIRIVVTGGLAGNFISPIFMFLVLKIIALPIDVVGPFVAFGVGMGGKQICLYVEAWFVSQKPLGKTKNE